MVVSDGVLCQVEYMYSLFNEGVLCQVEYMYSLFNECTKELL